MTPPQPPTPRTTAGRELLERESLNSRSFPLITPDAILAIETEAAESALAALRAQVEALPIAAMVQVPEADASGMAVRGVRVEAIARPAVIALLSGAAPAAGEK